MNGKCSVEKQRRAKERVKQPIAANEGDDKKTADNNNKTALLIKSQHKSIKHT